MLLSVAAYEVSGVLSFCDTDSLFFNHQSPRNLTFPSDSSQGFCLILVLLESNFYLKTNSDTLSVLKIALPQSVGQTCYYVIIEFEQEQTIFKVCVGAYSRQVPCKCHPLPHFVLHQFCFTKMWRHKFLCNVKALHILVYLQEWPLVAEHQKTKQGQ